MKYPDWVIFGLAVFRRNIGQYEKALVLFFSILKKNPDHVGCHLHVGLIRGVQGDLTAAAKHLQKAREINLEGDRVNLELSFLHYTLDNKDKALEYAKKALVSNPLNASAHLHIAVIYRDMGLPEVVKLHLDEALKLNLKTEALYFEWGLYYRSVGDTQAATDNFHKVIEINPCHGSAYCYLGVGYFEMGDYIIAEQNFKKYLELVPNVKGLDYYFKQIDEKLNMSD